MLLDQGHRKLEELKGSKQLVWMLLTSSGIVDGKAECDLSATKWLPVVMQALRTG